IQSVTDENRTRTFTWTSAVDNVTSLSAQTPDGATTTYDYLVAPFPTTTFGHQLNQVVMPGDSSAYETVFFDSLMHVKTLNDALGNATAYYSAGFLREQLGRGEVHDPVRAVTTTYKDFFGDLLQEID